MGRIGMPAPVWKYIQTNNLQNVAFEQLAILNLYKQVIPEIYKLDLSI